MTKDIYTKIFLEAAEQDSSDDNIQKYKKLWWWNYRKKATGGFRLTQEGFDFIVNEADIHTYEIEFPKEFGITPQVLIWLDHYINSPFYITNRHITVIKEREAFELYLLSGDIRKLGHNKAMNKRLSQE